MVIHDLYFTTAQLSICIYNIVQLAVTVRRFHFSSFRADKRVYCIDIHEGVMKNATDKLFNRQQLTLIWRGNHCSTIRVIYLQTTCQSISCRFKTRSKKKKEEKKLRQSTQRAWKRCLPLFAYTSASFCYNLVSCVYMVNITHPWHEHIGYMYGGYRIHEFKWRCTPKARFSR